MKPKWSVAELPNSQCKTAVVIDAMCAVEHWPFGKDEFFESIAQRHKHCLLTDLPPGTEIIHFCCDHYKTPSFLKAIEHQHRFETAKPTKVYEVSDHVSNRAPDTAQLFMASANKAGLLNYVQYVGHGRKNRWIHQHWVLSSSI